MIPNATDWTPHDGGECPCGPDEPVEIHMRITDRPLGKHTYPASKLRWKHRRDCGDIIAWRRA